MIAGQFNITLSCQKANAGDANVMMYDAGAYWQNQRWHIETEYLRKHYADGSFTPVNAVDAFAAYRLPLKKGLPQYHFSEDMTICQTIAKARKTNPAIFK